MPELMENIEEKVVIGPGQILTEARVKRGFSQQDVADKLNFRVSLVSDIEEERFDKSLPETYNRGYLKNYAKLVNISIDDVLASYDMLNDAKVQASEMLSFSKGTIKEAENNLLMWISYLILAVLVGLTVMWWLQGESRTLTLTSAEQLVTPASEDVIDENKIELAESIEQALLTKDINVKNIVVLDDSPGSASGDSAQVLATDSSNDEGIVDSANSDTPTLANNVGDNTITTPNSITESTPNELIVNDVVIFDTPPVVVTFTFSGDCWVNIYDATGERIAWGIKKLGYVMNINGQAPFNVTLGKPELVTVNFDGQAIDMAQFRVGQIAKFSLPIAP